MTLLVEGQSKIGNRIDLIENVDTNAVKLICNATAKPSDDLVYEWYLNNLAIAGKQPTINFF